VLLRHCKEMSPPRRSASQELAKSTAVRTGTSLAAADPTRPIRRPGARPSEASDSIAWPSRSKTLSSRTIPVNSCLTRRSSSAMKQLYVCGRLQGSRYSARWNAVHAAYPTPSSKMAASAS
jgi:hypothetical protein